MSEAPPRADSGGAGTGGHGRVLAYTRRGEERRTRLETRVPLDWWCDDKGEVVFREKRSGKECRVTLAAPDDRCPRCGAAGPLELVGPGFHFTHACDPYKRAEKRAAVGSERRRRHRRLRRLHLPTPKSTAASSPAPGTLADRRDNSTNTLDWDCIAAHESGGSYTIGGAEPYGGKYQFSLETWQALGFPGVPNTSPPWMQDQAALKLWAWDLRYTGNPWSAWETAPMCGL